MMLGAHENCTGCLPVAVPRVCHLGPERSCQAVCTTCPAGMRRPGAESQPTAMQGLPRAHPGAAMAKCDHRSGLPPSGLYPQRAPWVEILIMPHGAVQLCPTVKQGQW